MNKKANPKFLKEKPKMLGFDFEEFLLLGLVLTILNILNISIMISMPVVFGLAMSIFLTKRFLPRKHINHLLKFKKRIPKEKYNR